MFYTVYFISMDYYRTSLIMDYSLHTHGQQPGTLVSSGSGSLNKAGSHNTLQVHLQSVGNCFSHSSVNIEKKLNNTTL